MDLKTKVRVGISLGLLGVGGSLFVYSFPAFVDYVESYKVAEQKVKYIIDVDRNGVLSDSEWLPVYECVGKEPSSNLGLSDLEKFLERNI